MKNVIYLLFVLIATGCSSVPAYFYMNNSRFDSPEAIGKLGCFEISGAYESSTKVVVDRDITAPVPGSSGALVGEDPDSSTIRSEDLNFLDNIYNNFKFGLSKRLDIGFDMAIGDLPRVLKIKYQFMGQSQLAAEKDNVSGSVVFGAGFGNRDLKGSNTQGDTFDGELDYYTVTTSLILGRRIFPQMLLYYNLTGSLYYADLNLDRNLTLSGDSPYAYKSNGHQFLSLFGGRYFLNENNTFYASTEIGFAFTDWDSADSDDEFAFGFSIGGVF